MGSSKTVVLAALFANGAIAILKFVAFLLTGSASMLSETYHSVSDTGNQVFLLIGIRYSGQEADRRHPFGYGKSQFFYSFLVSVFLFGIAGWESTKHGFSKLTASGGHGGSEAVEFLGISYEPALSFDPVYVSYVVLIGAFAFETYALAKARAEMRRQMDRHGWDGYPEAFRKTSDVTTLTALTEDAVALAGIVLALIGLSLEHATGNPIYDAAAAFAIGLMLMGFALALAWENKRLILGESMPAHEERELRELVADWDGVEEVIDFRTVYFGPERIVVTADVAFKDDLDTESMDDHISAIEAALKESKPGIRTVYVEPET